MSTHKSPKNVKDIPILQINKTTIQPIHKYEISPEISTAVSDSHKNPFLPTTDSPCMRILMEVKKDYLLKTGKIKELNALNTSKSQPVLTKVSGVGSNVSKILQKNSRDYALSMGRSFRCPRIKIYLFMCLYIFIYM
jgi:hypothetical protein